MRYASAEFSLMKRKGKQMNKFPFHVANVAWERLHPIRKIPFYNECTLFEQVRLVTHNALIYE